MASIIETINQANLARQAQDVADMLNTITAKRDVLEAALEKADEAGAVYDEAMDGELSIESLNEVMAALVEIDNALNAGIVEAIQLDAEVQTLSEALEDTGAWSFVDRKSLPAQLHNAGIHTCGEISLSEMATVGFRFGPVNLAA